MMDRKSSYRLWTLGGVVFLVLFVVEILFDLDAWVGLLGGVVFLLTTIQLTKFYVCPHCGQRLDPRQPHAKYCPHCGRELD